MDAQGSANRGGNTSKGRKAAGSHTFIFGVFRALHGNIRNAVNFPEVVMSRESPYRLGIANANVPNMVGQISTAVAHAGLNIHNMLNKSRKDMAYTLVDVDSAVPRQVTDVIAGIAGVLAVHYLPAVP